METDGLAKSSPFIKKWEMMHSKATFNTKKYFETGGKVGRKRKRKIKMVKCSLGK